MNRLIRGAFNCLILVGILTLSGCAGAGGSKQGIWTVDAANYPHNRYQERNIFGEGETPEVVVAGYGGNSISIKTIETSTATHFGTHSYYVPPNMDYSISLNLPPGSYAVQLFVGGVLKDSYRFSVQGNTETKQARSKANTTTSERSEPKKISDVQNKRNNYVLSDFEELTITFFTCNFYEDFDNNGVIDIEKEVKGFGKKIFSSDENVQVKAVLEKNSGYNTLWINHEVKDKILDTAVESDLRGRVGIFGKTFKPGELKPGVHKFRLGLTGDNVSPHISILEIKIEP